MRLKAMFQRMKFEKKDNKNKHYKGKKSKALYSQLFSPVVFFHHKMLGSK